MTITEAAKAGIAKLRYHTWDEHTHARLDIFDNGMHGPWVTIVGGITETKVLIFDLPQDGWEEAK